MTPRTAALWAAGLALWLAAAPAAAGSLHDLARAGDLPGLRAALAQGIDPNARNAKMATPLMLAAEAGHTEAIRLLLARGALADLRDHAHQTALMLAAATGRTETVRILILEGHASWRMQDNLLGHTPLMRAVTGGHTSTVRALLDAGAGPAQTCDSGETAISLARAQGNLEIISALQSAMRVKPRAARPLAAASHPKVRAARERHINGIRALFAAKAMPYPPQALLLRAFKHEARIELWARGPAEKRFVHLTNYPVCAPSGTLGPKRREGDGQVPEGFYRINHFNPDSQFHLSLGLDYPNRSDRILGDPKAPGGAIYIHGNCVTIGCLPITDALIEPLFLIALDTSAAGGETLVHVFPSVMDGPGWQALQTQASGQPQLTGFWANLREGYLWFASRLYPPKVRVDAAGLYLFSE